MSSQALSDDQVATELKKMTAFIKQEALEKAREIQIKADEEFAIEKSKLVRSETSSIDAQYEKKFKQASMSQQITRSTMANKTRLRVLSARQSVLDDLFEQTRAKVGDVSKRGDYVEIMKGLLLEGLYALNEPRVQIRVRKADIDIVQQAFQGAREECKENLGKEVEVEIIGKDPLPEDSAGGLYIIGGQGKIEINNTLEERLRICETDSLPSVRVTLFGKNENRKFTD
ncbi:V-ATPase V1 sector subunit E [Endocarpon pusillum]|uniref:V-ATPase V1 sector subunit E n=1 Tax=Endocarpon pusillum TaxID=364733 RepID=A0A8H7AAV3_9EURO|nr:V-ATPase V1 sector subunit E [Endocarpon pusillum]